MIEFPITLISGGSVCLPGRAYALALGYTKNRGVYRLHVDATGEWEGLAIRCFWHVPDGKAPASSLVVDGYVAVPASVTAQPGSGCITFEGSDGAKVMTSADLRYRVSANSGTEDGTEPEPGTPAWQQLVDAVHADATAAEQAKTDAQTAAKQAGASAQKAGKALSDTITAKEDALKAIGDKQTTATQAVDTARDKALKQVKASTEAAQTAASEAATSAGSASQSAARSSAAASNANASAENAALAQVTTSQLAGQAADSASEAQNSATKADASASTAVQGQQRAEAAATRAETAQQQTESASTDALDKISSAKTDALKALDTKQTSATTAVESAQGKALDAVTDAQNTATQAVQAEQASATTAVKKAGAEVLTSIPEDYQTTVQKVKELDAQKVETDKTIGAVKARQNILVGTETGNPLSVDDAFPAPLCTLTVYGRSTQDGTPTPDAPVPIVSAGDGVSVAVKVTGKNRMPPNLKYNDVVECFVKKNTPITLVFKGDLVSQGGNILFFDENNNQCWFGIDAGKAEHHIQYPVDVTKFKYLINYMPGENMCLTWNASSPDYEPYREQLLTLPTPTGLPGIPVTSGGNYTDQSGQQWVCDEVDFAAGVYVQRIVLVDLASCRVSGITSIGTTQRITYVLDTEVDPSFRNGLCNRSVYSANFTGDYEHFYTTNLRAFVFIPSANALPQKGEYIVELIRHTPVMTPITATKIADYKALTTYGPDTVVQAGDGAGVKLEYQRDVNIVVKNLEDAIASMTTT